MIAPRLRETRDALVANASLRGRAFGAALSDALDEALRESFRPLDEVNAAALVALGSYARRELCPGSDVDVLLVHDGRSRRGLNAVRALAERLWYPLWDAGFVTGHGLRTVKESIALADDDIDALTALLDVRHVVGSEQLTAELERRGAELARKRSARMLRALADAAEVRRIRPGPVAEMLEPDLKEGSGGLRDVQSLEWAGWALGDPGGTATLLARGFLTGDDLARVVAGRDRLLDIRVALHRATRSRSDRLALQEQDAVADALGAPNADELVRDLSSGAREIAWTAHDVWLRVRDALDGPSGRTARADRALAQGVWLRDARVHVDADADGRVPALRTLEAAAAAAELDVPFDRASLSRMRATDESTWNVWERAAFLRLLRAGEHAIPVFEALDHEGVLTIFFPEWERVRSQPQRNAYHRFTVDRHLLEAVAQCSRLLDLASGPRGEGESVEVVVARACRRPELLLLGALLHDLAKGAPGDHSHVGAQLADRIARRMGLDSEGREIVVWLVEKHLLMAETATRRDLADATVADALAAACAGDAERLRLLYLLTIGDSLATGPAAWSPSKAGLLRDLFVKAAAAIERGEAAVLAHDRRAALAERLGAERASAFLARLPDSYVLAFDVDTMCDHEAMVARGRAVRCEGHEGEAIVTVVARDRPGLLATLAGALTVSGLDVLEANLFGTVDGVALDVFHAADPFGRVGQQGRVGALVDQALDGTLDVAARVEERRRSYAPREPAVRGPVHVVVDTSSSETDTVVEVHADDGVGVLYRLASTLTELDLDVRVAKVATLGPRVVDVFYVRDARGQKVDDHAALDRLRAAMYECLAD